MTTGSLERAEAQPVTREEPTRNGGLCFRPNVDIVETPDELIVFADVPGVAKDDVDIQFENGTLTLWGRVRPRQSEGTSFVLREYGVGDFHRSFRVSEQIDAGRITAKLNGGVLTLHLPKAEAARPRKISVKV